MSHMQRPTVQSEADHPCMCT